MATTTNYGWETPDDTDLVKDGASAIRTLGSSIDTTTKALNPSTTLGDIEYRSSTANTNTRLGIGTDGQVLTVSSGVPAWATASSGGLTLLSTTSLTGASVTVNSISQSYTHLILEISATSNTGASLYSVRVAPNGTTNITTQSGVAVGGAKETGSTYLWPNLDSNQSLTDTNNIHIVWIYNYASTSIYKGVSTCAGWVTSGGGNASSVSGGWIKTTSAISSLVFSMGAGDFDSGSVKIYGVK